MNSEFRSYLAAAALPFFLSRVFVIALIILAHDVTFESLAAREERSLHPRIEFHLPAARHALRCVTSSADAAWYIGIAESGYAPEPFTRTDPKNWVFFPLWPLLIRGLTVLTHSPALSGFILANVLFASGLILLQALAANHGFSDTARERMLWLACFFPQSYFFSSSLTEPLFFFLLTASWLAAERGRAVLAGLLFALLTATRPTGTLLLPALAILFAQRRLLLSPRGIGGLLLSPLGAVLYAAYLGSLTGNPLAFRENQPAWGRGDSLSFEGFFKFFAHPEQVMGPWIFYWLGIAILALSAATALMLIRKKDYAAAYVALVPPWFGFFTGTFLSIPRFALPLFPIYFALTAWTGSARRERAVLAVCAGLLGIMAAMYAAHVTAAMA